MFGEVLELEVWQEQVATLRKLPQHVLSVRLVQIRIVLQTRDLQELEAPLNVLFLQLQLRSDLIDLSMVEPAQFKRIQLQVLFGIT